MLWLLELILIIAVVRLIVWFVELILEYKKGKK